MRIAPKFGREILSYMYDNDLVEEIYRHHNEINGPQADLEPFIRGNLRLKDNSIEVTFSPNFGVLMYFKKYEKNDENCFMCIVKTSESPIKTEKQKRCKTILDLYFDILSKSPNDLIDIRYYAG